MFSFDVYFQEYNGFNYYYHYWRRLSVLIIFSDLELISIVYVFNNVNETRNCL
jgi:hypothetical protein